MYALLGIRPGALYMLSIESESEPYTRVALQRGFGGAWGFLDKPCFVCFGALLRFGGFSFDTGKGSL